MDAPSPLGDLIRNRRQALGLTQEELAEAVKVHVSSVISWESGEHYPKRKLAAIEKALGISLRDRPSSGSSEADALRAEAAELRETVISQAREIAALRRERQERRAQREQDQDAEPERGPASRAV